MNDVASKFFTTYRICGGPGRRCGLWFRISSNCCLRYVAPIPQCSDRSSGKHISSLSRTPVVAVNVRLDAFVRFGPLLNPEEDTSYKIDYTSPSESVDDPLECD